MIEVQFYNNITREKYIRKIDDEYIDTINKMISDSSCYKIRCQLCPFFNKAKNCDIAKGFEYLTMNGRYTISIINSKMRIFD